PVGRRLRRRSAGRPCQPRPPLRARVARRRRRRREPPPPRHRRAPHARAAGARELMLEVIVENAPAIALYEKLGFQTTRVVEVLTLDAAEVTDAQPIEAAEA